MLPKLYKDSAHALPGSRDLVSALDSSKAPWAIVTSGSRPLVTGWLNVLGLPHPAQMVTAEDVQNGKPDPACYALGRERLGLGIEKRILVLEDAPAGIKSGKSANCEVIAVSTSHSIEILAEMPEAKWLVKDLESVKFIGYDVKTGQVEVEISGALAGRYVQVK
jgi:glycerol 3-phosphatase-1